MGNSWRTSADITKTWQSVIFNLDSVVGLSMHAGPGAWNDPDMLQVGNSHELLHHGRERVHFGLWALMKAPLLIGADLRSLRRSSLKLLKSPGVVAINQDAMGVAGDLIYTHGSQQVRSSFSHATCLNVAQIATDLDCVSCLARNPITSMLTWSQLHWHMITPCSSPKSGFPDCQI